MKRTYYERDNLKQKNEVNNLLGGGKKKVTTAGLEPAIF